MKETPNSKPRRDDQPANPSGLTRRQWFLRLGEAAALAGFSGISAEELSGAALQSPGAAESQTSASVAGQISLPPGLYDASTDHLTHVLMRDQRFVNPAPGSETEYARPSGQPFVPAFFSAEEFPTVRRLVYVLLNAPAAGAAPLEPASAETVDEVAEWIDLVVAQSASVRSAARNLSPPHRTLAIRYHGQEEVQQLETADPQKVWKNGLAWLQAESKRVSGDAFLKLSDARQVDLLQNLFKESGARPSGSQAENPAEFARLLKRQVIEGYYTSQAGLKELDYQGNAFHGESPGCPTK